MKTIEVYCAETTDGKLEDVMSLMVEKAKKEKRHFWVRFDSHFIWVDPLSSVDACMKRYNKEVKAMELYVDYVSGDLIKTDTLREKIANFIIDLGL